MPASHVLDPRRARLLRAPIHALLWLVLATSCVLGVANAAQPGANAVFPGALGADPGPGYARLPGHVPAALARAELRPGRHELRGGLTLTVVLRHDDEAGFRAYLRDVYDAGSSQFQKFLTPAELMRRFGPSAQAYGEVRDYLSGQGFNVIEDSANHLTLTVRGSRAAAERAFAVHVREYRLGGYDGYAADADPAVPNALVSHVMAIDGLSSFAQPRPIEDNVKKFCNSHNWGIKDKNRLAKKRDACIKAGLAEINLYHTALCSPGGVAALGAAGAGLGAAGGAGGAAAVGGGSALGAALFCAFYDLTKALNDVAAARQEFAAQSVGHPPNGPSAQWALVHAATRAAAGPTGSGQTVGLVEFDAFHLSDVADYLALIGAPASQINNLSTVTVNGGVATPGAGETEVLLDIDAVMTIAPGAKVVVYEAPFDGRPTSYSAVFNAMINGGVTVISNSWASCEDQVSQAEAMSIDAVLQTAAAAGISVFNGTGDSGSTCLDGSANTIAVPADSPHATAVGGSSLVAGFGPGPTYGAETWWDGSADTPATGQGGYGVSRYFPRPAYQDALSSATGRSVPDVVSLADPAYGVGLCQADNGGCPDGYSHGGTSVAAPEWAAYTALLNQALNRKVGLLNTSVYPLATTPAFHGAASMGSDFAHVGLGSPNLNVLQRLVAGITLGTPTAAQSLAQATYQPASAILHPDGSYSVPADGTSPGGLLVTLVDANGYTVGGKTVTIASSSTNAALSATSGVSTTENGAVTITLTDLTAETVTLTATDTTDGVTLAPVQIVFGVPPAANAGLNVAPSSVAADGTAAATATVTLTDALGRPTPGKQISLVAGNSHAVITAPPAGVTDVNGQIAFSVTDVVNETVTLTAIDVTDGNLPVPGSGTVTFSGSVNTACGVTTPPVAASGYSITTFITGVPAAPTLFYGNVNYGCPGASNPIFTSGGAVLTASFLTGGFYRTGPAGGSVSSADLLATVGPTAGPLVYGKDGRLYAVRSATSSNFGSGEIIEVDPATAAVKRVVATGLTCPAGLAVDPLSGDLFFDDDCSGGGSDSPAIVRVIDPANSDTARPTSVVTYATLPTSANGGMAFAPNGTLYVVGGYYGNTTANVIQVSGTNSASVTTTTLTGIQSDFPVAIGAVNADGSAKTLLVEPAGVLREVPIGNPGGAVTIATTSPGIGTVGPDGCLYSAAYDRIYRLASTSGGCQYSPTSPAPALTLAATTSSAVQGSPFTVTAQLRNVSSPGTVAVEFYVNGDNGRVQQVKPDATGKATLSYTGAYAGMDTVIAVAIVGGTPLVSNSIPVTWSAGRDATFLSFSSAAKSASLATATGFSARLWDVSASPPAPVSGQSVTLALGSSTCQATTGTDGTARCALTATAAGAATLSASFAGTGALTPAAVSSPVAVAAPIGSAPTVTLSASPTSVVAGTSVMLTWSSTNATSCAASGGWSGALATSGSQTVVPAGVANYQYTLTCSGDGGMASATASVSATLAPVTVTAKSGGGGSLGYVSLFAIALLGWLRAGLRRSSGVGVALLIALILSGVAMPQATRAQDGAEASGDRYIGLRVGGMPVRVDNDALAYQLSGVGLQSASVSSGSTSVAGTLYGGYFFTGGLAAEVGYTHRDATLVTLTGTLPSAASSQAAAQSTANLLRGYGDAYTLSLTGRPRIGSYVTLSPRLGLLFWTTQIKASAGSASVHETHSGGGLAAGLGASVNIWRDLSLGLAVDHFRGSPTNIATLYSGTVEWRWGRSGQ